MLRLFSLLLLLLLLGVDSSSNAAISVVPLLNLELNVLEQLLFDKFFGLMLELALLFPCQQFQLILQVLRDLVLQ